VLANHYNRSRTEYAGHFDSARQKRDLTGFISYAVQGMLDGLKATVDEIQDDIWRIVWRSHVYDVFADYTDYRKKVVFKRRRTLALSMPSEPLTPEELLMQSTELVRQYLSMDRRTLMSDLDVLVQLGLVEEKDGRYEPALQRLSTHIAGCAI
jgi:DNA-binding transcriptional ArsR family regulator